MTKRLFLSARVAAGLILAALTGCTTVQETGRRQVNLFASQEAAMGLSEFDKMKQGVPISRDPAARAMVERVGRRIAGVANLPGAQWEFVVFDSPEANAFCLPGGKVGVYAGILPICGDDLGLATVIGHEVAHAYAHHGGERMTEAAGIKLIGEGAAAALGASDFAPYLPLFQQVYGTGMQLGVALPHSRTQESEADHIGLLFMARAGYDPRAAVEFWQRFSAYNQRQGGGPPWYLRTHPADDQRIADLQKLLPEASSQYHPR